MDIHTCQLIVSRSVEQANNDIGIELRLEAWLTQPEARRLAAKTDEVDKSYSVRAEEILTGLAALGDKEERQVLKNILTTLFREQDTIAYLENQLKDSSN